MHFKVLFLTFALSLPVAAQNLTITFQPPALPGGVQLVTEWIELGLRFSTPSGLASNDSSNNLFPSNGSAYLQALAGQSPLTIGPMGLEPFSVFSIDLAEYSTLFPAPQTITFVGTQVGGNTVSISFTTDGIIDGNGPLADFETFFFPSTFTNLTQITIGTDTYSMDNLVVAIPEPGAGLLLFVGAAFACAWRRRLFS